MHAVLLDIVHPHRLKSARSDMQRDEGMPDTASGERREQLGIEVQSRGRRRHRAGVARVYSLIALAIGGFRRPVHIGRQRHVAVALEVRQHRHGEFEAEQLVLAAQHARRGAAGQRHPRSRLQPLAGPRMHQRGGGTPSARSSRILDLAAALLGRVQSAPAPPAYR